MKKIIYSLLLVAATLFTSNAQRIAIVDINAVLGSMNEYTIAEKEIERISSEWRQEISKEYDKFMNNIALYNLNNK